MKGIVLLLLLIAITVLFTACPGAGQDADTEQPDDVLEIAVTGVTLNKSSATIILGNTEQLTATVEPADATDGSVTWESGNESAATVSADGLVTAVAGGTATITVTTTDGGFTDTCEGTVEIWTTSQSGSAGIAGSSITYTNHKDNFSFIVKACPGATFPTGTDDLGGDATASSFWIGETEITYELWYAVHNWALSNDYTFANPGREGHDGTITDPAGAPPTAAKYEPVTTINWRDAMIWCNALTEYYNNQNGTSLSCVYYSDSDYQTPIRTATNDPVDNPLVSGWEDQPYIKAGTNGNTDMANCTADGFRLMTFYEWQLAARYRDDAVNTVSGYSDPWFTQGDSASGAYTYYNDEADTNPVKGVVDGKDANDQVAVYSSYYDGGWVVTGVTGTAVVKSKTENSLGIYDMSGNVWEWCFDWHAVGSHRVIWSGRWSSNASYLQVGRRNGYNPVEEYHSLGIRLSRTP